ncbi:MAG TPA: hypothetical protein VID28_21235 [Methylomirabilota bacterium]
MRAWTWPIGLVLLGLSGAAELDAAEPAPTKPTGPGVDAEMLRDLDLLSSPDYARDREVARRMGLFERLRMIEHQAADEAVTAPSARPDPTRATVPPKEPR